MRVVARRWVGTVRRHAAMSRGATRAEIGTRCFLRHRSLRDWQPTAAIRLTDRLVPGMDCPDCSVRSDRLRQRGWCPVHTGLAARQLLADPTGPWRCPEGVALVARAVDSATYAER